MHRNGKAATYTKGPATFNDSFFLSGVQMTCSYRSNGAVAKLRLAHMGLGFQKSEGLLFRDSIVRGPDTQGVSDSLHLLIVFIISRGA